jgi:hypothetical protein
MNNAGPTHLRKQYEANNFINRTPVSPGVSGTKPKVKYGEKKEGI